MLGIDVARDRDLDPRRRDLAHARIARRTGTANVEHLERNVAATLGPPLPEADAARLRELFGGLVEAV